MVMPGEALNIPKAFWEDKAMSDTDILLMAVVAQCDEKFGCYMSDDELMGLCRCSADEFRESLSWLLEKEYLYVEDPDAEARILHAKKLTGGEGYDVGARDTTFIKLIGDVSDELEYPARDVAAMLVEKDGTTIRRLGDSGMPVADVCRGVCELESMHVVSLQSYHERLERIERAGSLAFEYASAMGTLDRYSVNDIFVWLSLASRYVYNPNVRYDSALISEACRLDYDVAVESIKKLAWDGLLEIRVDVDGRRIIKPIRCNADIENTSYWMRHKFE